LDLREGASLAENENQKDSPSSSSLIASDLTSEFKHRRSSSKWNEELSPASSAVTETTQAGNLMNASKLAPVSFADFFVAHSYIIPSKFPFQIIQSSLLSLLLILSTLVLVSSDSFSFASTTYHY
jgi:hypothetical protein